MQLIAHGKPVAPDERRNRLNGLITHQIHLIMRLTAALVLGLCLHVSAATRSQNVTLSEKNTSLENVFKKIKQQTGITFVYRQEWMEQTRKVDVNVVGVPVSKVLEACFKNQPFSYTIIHNTVVLKEKEPAPPVEKDIVGNSFRTAGILNYDFGMQYLNTYLQFVRNIEAAENKKPVSSSDLCEQYVKSDTLKGIYLLNALSQSKAYDNSFITRAEQLEKYLLTPRLKGDFQTLVTNLKTVTKGQPAIDFGGTTPQGKQVSLADLKGKLVVVDLWATWCVPCKKEILFLKKLEEEMEGKDVAFLSLAISDNKENWLKFVTEESLGGVQLFADAKAEDLMTNTYKVTGIPRFMVFDRDGNIVSIDAPRPSSPALKALIEKELN